MREKVKKLVESSKFQNFIIWVIVFNAIILGMETSRTLQREIGGLLSFLDNLAIAIFTVEIALRIYAHRWPFFKGAWNVFDFTIVVISLIPSSGPLAVFRTLRILRVLRLISNVKSMRNVIESLVKAIPGISSVTLIVTLIFYIFAVIGTKMFGEDFPQWFGDLGTTMFTLFQVMTLESWSMGIVRPVMELYPNAWLFFSLYILVTTFTMLNLFIAVIVNAMQKEADTSEADRHAMTEKILHSQHHDSEQILKYLEEMSQKIEKLEQDKSKVSRETDN